ncbi:Dihydropteroate synthase [Cylindrobasidium torrendii FP15055 ss-10]|uniref:Dihydropteroate synthase n=1 Tax=Cylindrobasidium torrendii FP15055 ss-10 TaxID=1314674 RepID=A0A0D7BD54_9AGAR|nr:Dihydropteroate synthase [Cylindrobasidium torrendii FP15055 ss-10]
MVELSWGRGTIGNVVDAWKGGPANAGLLLLSLSAMTSRDWIRVRELSTDVLLASGARWPPKVAGKATLQPICITISIPTDVSYSAQHDDLASSINYSTIASGVRSILGSGTFTSLEHISRYVFDHILLNETFKGQFDQLHLRIAQLRPPVHCKTAVLETSAKRTEANKWTLSSFKHILEDIECNIIIGVNECERSETQLVRVNVEITGHASPSEHITTDVREVVRRLYDSALETNFLTLEALTSRLALTTLQELYRQGGQETMPTVNVKACKPFALVYAGASEVEVTRTYLDYPGLISKHNEPSLETSLHSVAVAFGSNIGDSFQHIEDALNLLESKHTGVSVVNTSFLYESAPMYVEDQPKFINGACMIETSLNPKDLLQLLKNIEEAVGRVESIRNGPRAVDLDIVFYDSLLLDTRADKEEADHLNGNLVIPHPRMSEREFVLRPLNDMIPDFLHPLSGLTVAALLNKVASDPTLHKVMPVPQQPSVSSPQFTHKHLSFSIAAPQKMFPRPRTQLMAIVNTTPDSFSDGSDHLGVSAALDFAKAAVQDGANILDIGGYSTRPGAANVSTADEIDRVVPVIQAIRTAASTAETLISVDTFRAEVAQKAIQTGANIINDVYAFTGPDWPVGEQANVYREQMKAVARKYNVPVILMHSRGEANENKDYSEYQYAGKDKSVTEAVRVELGRKVDEVVLGKGGVRRWMVMVDPGVGFSKTVEGNLEVLRNAAEITADILVGPDSSKRRNALAGYPMLIGASRKSFLGKLLGRETQPKERGMATAATTACAVQQGASVVRVHDVQETADVLRVADSLWL